MAEGMERVASNRERYICLARGMETTRTVGE
jgi:hypothetical protein